MKLTGRVIEIKSGSESTDKHERVTMRLSPGPGRFSAILILPNDEGWKLDDPVEVSISMGATEDEDPTSTLRPFLERQTGLRGNNA